jgi:hypothetical protein
METNNPGPIPRALEDWTRDLYVRKSRQHSILGNLAFRGVVPALIVEDQHSAPESLPHDDDNTAAYLFICLLTYRVNLPYRICGCI